MSFFSSLMSGKKEKKPPIEYINFYFSKDPTKVKVEDKDKNKTLDQFLLNNQLIKDCNLKVGQFRFKLKETEKEIINTVTISSILNQDILIQVIVTQKPKLNKYFYPLESISEVFDITSSSERINWPYINGKAQNLFTPIGSIDLSQQIEFCPIKSNNIPKISLVINSYNYDQPEHRTFEPIFDFREVDIGIFVDMISRMIGCIEPKHVILSYDYNDFKFKSGYLKKVNGKIKDFPLHESNSFTAQPVYIRWVFEQNARKDEGCVATTDYSLAVEMKNYIKTIISKKYQIPMDDLIIENIPVSKKVLSSCAIALLLRQNEKNNSFLKVSVNTSNHSHGPSDNYSKSQVSQKEKHPNNNPKSSLYHSQNKNYKSSYHNKESDSESSDENQQNTSKISHDSTSLNKQDKKGKSKDPELSKSVINNSRKKSQQPENIYQSQGSHKNKNSTTKTQCTDKKSFVSNVDLNSDDEIEANVEERTIDYSMQSKDLNKSKKRGNRSDDNKDVQSATPLPKPEYSVPVKFDQQFVNSIDNSTFQLTFDNQEVPYKEIIQQVSERVQRKTNDIQLSKNEIVYKTTQPIQILNDGIPIIVSNRPFIVKFKITQENRLMECDKLNKNMAISEVKEVLANELNVDSSLIRLNFAGKILQDNAILNSLHLNPKSTINVFIQKESEILVTIAALNPTHFDIDEMIGEIRATTNRDEDLCRAVLQLKNYDIEASIKALNEVYKAELCDEELENDEDGTIEEQIDEVMNLIGANEINRLKPVLPNGINLYHGILIWNECDKNMEKVKNIMKSITTRI